MAPTNDRVRLSKVSISRYKEDTYNGGQTLDVSLETDKSASIPNPSWDVLNNAGRASGKEFPDQITSVILKSYGFPLKFDYLKAHEAEAVFAYGLGGRDEPALIGQGQYRKKYYTSNERERPSFMAGFQLSDGSPVAKVLTYGNKVNTITFAGNRAERFPTINADVVASGKNKVNVYDEVIVGSHTLTSLTLGRAVEGALAGGAPEAEERLDAVHILLADVDGDGVYEEEVHVTAASDATPSVLTIVPPGSEPYRVAYDDNGYVTDYTEAAKDITTNDVPAGLVMDEDRLLLGFKSRVASVWIDVGGTANAVATSTLAVKYWDGKAWTAVSNLSDGTQAGGISLAVDGTIRFQMPTDWQRKLDGAEGTQTALFWLELTAVTASFTPGTVITQVYASPDLKFDSVQRLIGGVWTDETADAADYAGGTVQMAIATTGALLLGSKRPFGGASFDMAGTAQAQAATLTAKYWNGAAWVAVAGLDQTDTEASAGVPFSQDGDITWTPPTASKAVAGTNTSAFAVPMTDATKYHWIKIETPSNLTAGAVANSIRLLDKQVNYLAIYRSRESLYFTEYATAPDPDAEETALAIHMARVVIGGKFDGVNIDGGYTHGCSLNSFSLSINNNHSDPQSCWQGESNGAYGDELLRGDPEVTMTVNRKLLNWLVQRQIKAGDYFSIHLEFWSDEIPDTDPAIRDKVIVHLDRCWYENAPIGQTDNRYTEEATIRVGQSDEHPAVVVIVENQDAFGFADEAA